MDEIQFTEVHADDSALGQDLIKRLVEYNDTVAPKEDWKGLLITATDSSSRLIGGVKGYTHWNWVFVSHLWVSDSYRSRDLGSSLMKRAETVGKLRGCHSIWVDTFSFQAVQFYEKLGYRKFGVLEDFPPGHFRYFLQKKLS